MFNKLYYETKFTILHNIKLNVENVKNNFIYKFTDTSSIGEPKVSAAGPYPGEGGYPHLLR